jgi:galactokinase
MPSKFDPVSALQAAGYDASAAVSRAHWLTRVSDHFTQHVGAPPQWRWCVPGRIEIFGKHTDYAGGESLLAAVPRGFVVVARPRTDRCIRVIDVRHGDETMIDLDDSTRVYRGWANYAAVTLRRLAQNFSDAAWGTDIAIASDLPRAAGLSSSSALVVGVATAIVRRAELDARDDWRQVIASVEDLAWYLGCVENGLDYKSLTGVAGVGTHGGSQDHTAILACRPGVVSHYGFMPVRALGVAPMPAGWRFVIASSGVHADKAGSVKDRYNRAALAVRALVAIWNQTHTTPAAPHPSSLAAVLGAAPDNEARLRHAVDRADAPGFTAADLHRRLSQVVQELTRIPLAVAAFAQADAEALGALTRASQHDAEELLGNQVPETVALCRSAYDHGAFAASAFGAGFGGSVWALVSAAEADTFGPAWLAQYCRQFPNRENAEWFSAVPGPGVLELTNE